MVLLMKGGLECVQDVLLFKAAVFISFSSSRNNLTHCN